ncbi:MAG: PAS domain S-box protein [Methylococcaceae bacterium]|nr:PAS domain S-box protein [Methylococcaceae bacterium]
MSQSERRYSDLFDSAPDGIFTTSIEGRFTSMNPAMEKILGWSADDLMGKFYAEWVHPEDLQRANATFLQVATGMPGEVEARIRTRSGLYQWLQMTGSPRIEDGQVVEVLVFMRDVTERRQAEQALHDSEEKFRAISNSAQNAILMMDPEGAISYWNPAAERIFGYPAESVLGKKLHEWLAPERFLEAFRKGFDHFRITGEGPAIGKTLELVAKRDGGEEFPIELSLSAIQLGERWNAVGIVRDITSRKKTEEEIHQWNTKLEQRVTERTQQLLDAQKELVSKEKLAVLGQVASSVGHELRNPLGVMNNAVYFLKTVLSGADETVREYLDMIEGEIGNADRIVSDLLDSVRTKPPFPQPMSVNALIQQSLQHCTIPEQVIVHLEIAETLPSLRVDPAQMQQVFRNLISNAVDAMPGGGRLTIDAAEAAGAIRIGVQDNGMGITQQDLAKLFQPLFTTKSRGVGLGLMVVKNLTQVNGGRVEVQSEPGKGTSFFVILPCESAAETA